MAQTFNAQQGIRVKDVEQWVREDLAARETP
jgi:hypothetical protein